MAELLFKRGTQAQLQSATVVDGAFYLTTDTDRLYVGQPDGELALLNSTVKVVASTSALPQQGTAHLSVNDFYYITDINCLAVWNGAKWVQINSFEDFNSYVTALADVVSLEGKIATIKSQASITKHDHGVAAGEDPTLVTSDGFQIEAGDNISLAVAGKKITISTDSDIQTLSAAADGTNQAKIALTEGGDVKVKGEGAVKVAAANNVVTVSVDAQAIAGNALASAELSTEAQGFKLTTNTVNGVSDDSSIDPVIKVGKTESSVHFANGVADLDVYTITEVDTLLADYEKKVNAMTYKGVWSSATLPANPELGDVYKFSQAVGSYDAGDVIIYNGAGWDHIPSGDDFDTTYSVEALEHGIRLLPSTEGGASATPIGGISLVAGDIVELSDVAGANNQKQVTVKHAAITTGSGTVAAETMGSDNSKTFTVVAGLENDGHGHITKVNTKDITVNNTTYTLEDESLAFAADSTTEMGLDLSITLRDNDGNTDVATASAKFALAGNLKAEGNSLKLEWGSF